MCLACFSCGERGHDEQGSWAGWLPVRTAHAHFFRIWEHGEDRLVLTLGPSGDTTGLFQLSPDDHFAPAPLRALPLRTPVDRVALWSTTHASFITALGGAGRVVACAHAYALKDTALVRARDAGRLMELAHGNGLDQEALIAAHPEVFFSYPFGTSGLSMEKSGAAVVNIGEYLEEDPLGRAEWLRVFGSFLGREKQADSLFKAIEARYGAVAQRASEESSRPVVFMGSAWKGAWSVPTGNSWMAHLIQDAGGHYLFADRRSTGNIDIDLEQVVARGTKADVWGRILDQERPVTAADVAGDDPRILALPAFRQHRCFFANSMHSDFFGRAVIEPDVLLLDMAQVLHPDLAPGRVPVYFKPVP